MILVLALFAFSASAERVTPVEKVITLIQDLQSEVQNEGIAEASAYDTFSCFCKDKTDGKTLNINNGENDIETLTGTHIEKTALRDQLIGEIDQAETDKATLEAELAKAQSIRDNEKAVYTVAFADMSKAVSSLNRAVTTLSGSEGPSGAGLVRLNEVKATVQQSLALADAMNIAPSNKKVMTALLSGDWEEPEEDYDFHSGDIISTLTDLQTDFTKRKNKLESEENTAASNFALAAAAKRGEITAKGTTITTKNNELSACKTVIATTESDLATKKALLNDDQLYLKDLTEQCETRARQWDQRSQMRKDELAAISQALSIMTNTVQGKETASGAGGRVRVTMLTQDTSGDDEEESYEDVVFVQKKVARHVSQTSVGRARVISLLKAQSKKLNSFVLASIAMKVAADPFAKVKTLIQQLIERLLKESKDEASKNGWCETELAKARTDRDYRQADVEDYTAKIEKMSSTKAQLLENKSELTTNLQALNEALRDSTLDRANSKRLNQDAIRAATEGLVALKAALKTLDDFYRKAGRATTSLVQQKASPVDADIAAGGKSAGFDGAYTGGQERATGVIGMLQTIQSDFERTVKETTEAEEQGHRDFVKFSRETSASIKAHETGLEHTNNEIQITTNDLNTAHDDLQTNQDLLDSSLQTLEQLKPACVDTGMSWDDRVAARQAEIDALKKAVCVLDEEDGDHSEYCAGVAAELGFLQRQ